MPDEEKAAVDHDAASHGAAAAAAATGAVDGGSDRPPHHGMSPAAYMASRFTTLKPPMLSAPNPIRLVLMLNRHHWAFFFVAFWAWVSPSVPPPSPRGLCAGSWCPQRRARRLPRWRKC